MSHGGRHIQDAQRQVELADEYPKGASGALCLSEDDQDSGYECTRPRGHFGEFHVFHSTLTAVIWTWFGAADDEDEGEDLDDLDA